MTTGSYSNPIIVDCEAHDGTSAGRRCHDPSASNSSTLRARRRKPKYCLRDLFSCTEYGIESLRSSRRAPGKQRPPSSPTRARRDGISAKPMTFKELVRNKMTRSARQLARRELARRRLFSDTPCCSCTEDEGCAESCQNRAMCYDCDENNCRLGPRCTNRLANKLEARCKVLPAGDRGFGLFADESIHRNQFVAQYTGEVITMNECRERYCSIYSDRQVHYVMYMDMGFACDATSVGSKARFLNHHCDPNCVVRKRVVSGEQCLFIFAKRHVGAGEELTLNYKFDTFPGAKEQPCLCGAENCCGFLGR